MGTDDGNHVETVDHILIKLLKEKLANQVLHNKTIQNTIKQQQRKFAEVLQSKYQGV